jgi:hypothetical protein
MLVTIRDALSKERGWVAANLIGISVGVLFDLWLTMPRETELASPLLTASIGLWVVTAFTTLLVILIVNVIWLIRLCWGNRGLARLRALGAWVLVCCLWLVPVYFNRLAPNLLELARLTVEGRLLRH